MIYVYAQQYDLQQYALNMLDNELSTSFST